MEVDRFWNSLTDKQLDVLSCIIFGLSSKVIGKLLGISNRTVEHHVQEIFHKANLNNRGDLISHVRSSNDSNLFKILEERYKIITTVHGNSEAYEGHISNFLYFSRNRKYFYASGAILFLIFFITAIWIHNSFFHRTKITNVFLHTANYLYRTNCMKEINDAFKKQSVIKTVVLSGMGGSGKTTLARLFFQSASAELAWEVNAESSDTIFLSFWELAEAVVKNNEQKEELLNIKDIDDNKYKRWQLLRFIANVLQNYSEWIILFDNVSDIEQIAEWLPKANWGNGELIITTRNKNIANSLLVKPSIEICIDTLSPQEKRDLFCKIMHNKNFKDTKSLEVFLQSIPSMPLDVSTAAHYLQQTQESFDEYLKIAHKNTVKFEKMQSKLMKAATNYEKTRVGIITSTCIEILKQNRHFFDLLLFVCLVDSQAIHIELLKMIKDTITVDDFIYNLRQHSLASCKNQKIFIHRSVQDICLNYLLSDLTPNQIRRLISLFSSAIMEYKKHVDDIGQLVPHLTAFLNNIDHLQSDDLDDQKSDLLILLGDIYRHELGRIDESGKCYQQALSSKNLTGQTAAELNLKLGELYVLMGKDNEALIHLNVSQENLLLPLNSVQRYRLLGIVHMRENEFTQANTRFDQAIKELRKINEYPIEVESDIYADKAFNYFMDGINRKNAHQAAGIMQKAVDILKTKFRDNPNDVKLSLKLAHHIARLAGIYNALSEYNMAIKLTNESTKILASVPSGNRDIISHPSGIIERERGLAALRLNKINEAYDHFSKAKKFFQKAHSVSYLFKLKNHEIETLIRLHHFDTAKKICEEVFSLRNRERNNYSDLFFNTCYFHAAIINLHKHNEAAAMECFHEFFRLMQQLCKQILSTENYAQLIQQKVFEGDNVSQCLVNSLIIFEQIYWKDYEFTKYYIEPFVKHQWQ